MPDSIEGLTHVEQNSDGGQILVVGVRQLGNNPDELKGRRVLSAEAELLLPNETIQPVSYTHLDVYKRQVQYNLKEILIANQ